MNHPQECALYLTRRTLPRSVHYTAIERTFSASQPYFKQFSVDMMYIYLFIIVILFLTVLWYQPSQALRSASANQAAVPTTHRARYGDRAFTKAGPVLHVLWKQLPEHLKYLTENIMSKCLRANLGVEHYTNFININNFSLL